MFSSSSSRINCPRKNSRLGTNKFLILDRTRPAPISRLYDDLLWHIFSFNILADVEMIDEASARRDFSLITARHTSQVCMIWRRVMLASSSIWANTINLTYLGQLNDNWRNEVLKRTGNALLSVLGSVDEETHTTEFFLTIWNTHWTRLRRLSVWVRNENSHGDKRWLSMQRPGLKVEIFQLHFQSRPTFSNVDDMLFANDAPSIHTLIISSVNFTLSRLRLSCLRCLELHTCSFRQTVLSALAEMLSLEALEIKNTDILAITAEDYEWPRVILPKLRLLTLSVNITTLILLLGHITPTDGSDLNIECFNSTAVVLSNQDTVLLQQGFLAHFQSFSDYSKNEALSFEITKYSFTLKNVLNQGDNDPQPSLFKLCFSISSDFPWYGMPNIIMDSLHSSTDLSLISTLEILTAARSPICSDPSFAQLLGSLSSVDQIYTDSETMEILLWTRHEEDVVLFPLLRRIVFDSEAKLQPDMIMQFLLRRRDEGVPIKWFDLECCGSPNQDRLIFLNGIEGLTVVWSGEMVDEILGFTE